MKNFLALYIITYLLYSCIQKPDAQDIIDKSISVHGGQSFINQSVEFDFRDKHYSVVRAADSYIYTREFEDDSLGYIKDTLVNSIKFRRFINDTAAAVNDEWKNRYSSSINSVLYFFQLPLGLNDKAVKKVYLGEKYFNQVGYHKIKVTFKKKGGGQDYEDVFIYWINKSTSTVDYLAYSYATDGGGTRFRQAINRRKLKGMLFQDYINYKAKSKNTPIEEHDELFIKGELMELSRIENENIRVH